MIKMCLYIILLLLIFFLSIQGITYCFKYAQKKIKVLCSIPFMLIVLQVSIQLIMIFINNIGLIYYFRFIYYIPFLSMPIIAMVSTYIFARSDKFKFNFIIIIASIITLIYILMLTRLDISIRLWGNLTYQVVSNNNIYEFLTCLILNCIFLFIAFRLVNRKLRNKIGLIFILISSIVSICETIFAYTGLNIFPQSLIGLSLWIITTNYALSRLK